MVQCCEHCGKIVQDQEWLQGRQEWNDIMTESYIRRKRDLYDTYEEKIRSLSYTFCHAWWGHPLDVCSEGIVRDDACTYCFVHDLCHACGWSYEVYLNVLEEDD